ncbi:MAG: MFS transporter [Acidimicrobiia bacterium]
MARLTVDHEHDAATLDRLLAPRDDVVAERRVDGGGTLDGGDPGGGGADPAPDGDRGVVARFALAHGPFARYERTVEVGGGRITERFDYSLPPGTWPFLVNLPIRLALRRPPRGGRLPWWYPPQRPDARAATVLGLLATLSLVVGYHGTLLTQTMTFAADEFGADTAAQGDAFAAVRLGGILAVALGAAADRRGRRRILTLALLVSAAATVAGAFAPNLAALAATQTVNRGAWAASSIMLGVIAAEEMPAGARAYAVSLLSMTGALGAGVALWLLPLADLGPRTWRLLYLLPLLFVPVILRFGRLVPESRRFVRPHRDLPLTGHRGRLALLVGATFLLNVFTAPESQFRNEFLRDDRGMSAAMISLFVVVTTTPGSIGIVVGGRLADVRGRRVVAATAVSVGAVLLAASFATAGGAMWATALVGGIFLGALVPSYGTYSAELFPTSLRGRVGGITSMCAMAGSVTGLVAAGRLRDAVGSFGATMGVLAAAPLAMALVVLLLFPETARRELEDLNPEDRTGATGTAHPGDAGTPTPPPSVAAG